MTIDQDQRKLGCIIICHSNNMFPSLSNQVPCTILTQDRFLNKKHPIISAFFMQDLQSAFYVERCQIRAYFWKLGIFKRFQHQLLHHEYLQSDFYLGRCQIREYFWRLGTLNMVPTSLTSSCRICNQNFMFKGAKFVNISGDQVL